MYSKEAHRPFHLRRQTSGVVGGNVRLKLDGRPSQIIHA
jgi:hypothetical protein